MIPVCYYFICITVGSCKKIVVKTVYVYTLYTDKFAVIWSSIDAYADTLALRLYPVNNNEWWGLLVLKEDIISSHLLGSFSTCKGNIDVLIVALVWALSLSNLF